MNNSKPLTKELLIEIVKTSQSFSQVLKKLNKNKSFHTKLRLMLTTYNIDYTHFKYSVKDDDLHARLEKRKAWEKNYKKSYFRDPNKTLLIESRRIDKRKGFKNNLTFEFVKNLTTQPCFYCGETLLKISADRIDNSIGHEITNVNPACIRCNYLRGNMPYEAWMNIVPSIRDTRQKGLFGTWRCKSFKWNLEM